jgi:hypothetical protein
MIISHAHRYLYVELPHTGTTAIANELRQHYAGSDILRKHAHYGEFLRVASPDEKRYFVFSGIRNPLDEAVSIYFKYKTDHRRRYSQMEARRTEVTGSATRADAARYRAVHAEGVDFGTYFRRYYRWPYNNWSSLHHKRFNYIIRFEQLQAGFAEALRCAGIEPKRPLPLVNRTSEKRDDFWSYFSPDLFPQARRVFGPFMHEWGYTFPPEWGEIALPPRILMEYRAVNLFRNFYWHYLRWHPSYGRLLKALR